MKKSKNIISDWLDQYGDPEIDRFVEKKLANTKNDEDDFDIYTKSEVIGYMASQGLVYSGLDEHQDAWFENYYREWFQMLNNDQYILHGEG